MFCFFYDPLLFVDDIEVAEVAVRFIIFVLGELCVPEKRFAEGSFLASFLAPSCMNRFFSYTAYSCYTKL